MSIEGFGPGTAGSASQKLPFSKAVRAGGFVCVWGQIAVDAKGEVIAYASDVAG